MDKEAVFLKLKEIMIKQFKLNPDSITPEKNLFDELDLDSLDLVDIIISLNDHISGEKIEPTLFKDACTVQDIVDLVQPRL